MKEVFVFGSNLAGQHGAGSAHHAMQDWGAEKFIGVGPSGNAYAIPTKDSNIEVLPLNVINLYVQQFICYAHETEEMRDLFEIARAWDKETTYGENPYDVIYKTVPVGCGLSGYNFDDIAPMFLDAPDNVVFTDPNFAERVNHFREQALKQMEEGFVDQGAAKAVG